MARQMTPWYLSLFDRLVMGAARRLSGTANNPFTGGFIQA